MYLLIKWEGWKKNIWFEVRVYGLSVVNFVCMLMLSLSDYVVIFDVLWYLKFCLVEVKGGDSSILEFWEIIFFFSCFLRGK